MESTSVSGNKDVEDAWSDLHSLKKLYGLLQRTDGLMTLQGECLNIMDEKSRQLLKKLLDVATQEAIQCHSKIISKPLELVNPPEKTQEEPKTNPSIDILEGKTQEAEKLGKTEAAKKACKRAELKHQRSDKKMKTGSDLKPRKRSEHPLPDVHRHRARNQASSSGDPNRLRPSGSSSSLMRNPSQLGRSSKRTRVDAPVRTRQVLRPVDELTRHRRVGETNSVQSQLSHRRDRGSKLSGTSPSLVRKRLAPFQPKTEKKDSLSRYQIIRVKPMRQHYSSRSESTFTGTQSTSVSDDTVSRRRVPMLVHSEKRRPRRSLSQHKRVSPTRRSMSKEKKGGRLKRLKDKLAVIFHHHHHHHHYHHNHRDEEVEVHRNNNNNNNNNNHASPWRYLRRMVRRRSKEDKRKVTTRTRRERVAERMPGQQQRLGFLHVLLDALLRHVWGTQQRRKAQAKWRRLGNAGEKPHWWQLFKRRAVGLKLANRNKPRLKLGFRRSHTRRKLTNINI